MREDERSTLLRSVPIVSFDDVRTARAMRRYPPDGYASVAKAIVLYRGLCRNAKPLEFIRLVDIAKSSTCRTVGTGDYSRHQIRQSNSVVHAGTPQGSVLIEVNRNMLMTACFHALAFDTGSGMDPPTGSIVGPVFDPRSFPAELIGRKHSGIMLGRKLLEHTVSLGPQKKETERRQKVPGE